MTKDEIQDFKEMRKVVADTANTVQNISIALMGDPKNHEDFGLFGDVRNNKRWRSNVNKMLGSLGLGFLGLLIKGEWQRIFGK